MKAGHTTGLNQFYKDLPVAYHSLDRDGMILDVNNIWLKTLDYKREEVTGRWFGEFIAEEMLDTFRKKFADFQKSGKLSTAQLVLVNNKHKKRIFVSVSGNVEKLGDGSIRMHCIFENISKLKETEDKLQMQNYKYISLYEKYESQLEEQKAVNETLRENNAIIRENQLRLQLE
ncbi:MAG: PAS domain-containing protein [Bacteroidetes bacterium]|nr:PAS domain-containing protein [Bacteroidota bacterium]